MKKRIISSVVITVIFVSVLGLITSLLLKDVNKNVSKIIVNEDKTHYYRRPYAIYLTICESVGKWIKNVKIEEKAHKKLVQYIVKSQMKYEQKKYEKEL